MPLSFFCSIILSPYTLLCVFLSGLVTTSFRVTLINVNGFTALSRFLALPPTTRYTRRQSLCYSPVIEIVFKCSLSLICVVFCDRYLVSRVLHRDTVNVISRTSTGSHYNITSFTLDAEAFIKGHSSGLRLMHGPLTQLSVPYSDPG